MRIRVWLWRCPKSGMGWGEIRVQRAWYGANGRDVSHSLGFVRLLADCSFFCYHMLVSIQYICMLPFLESFRLHCAADRP